MQTLRDERSTGEKQDEPQQETDRRRHQIDGGQKQEVNEDPQDPITPYDRFWFRGRRPLRP